jgi:hypothetical protein
MRKFIVGLALLIAVIFAAPPAFAQAAKGENVVAIREPVTTKLAGGKSYMTQSSGQVCMTSDPKHPLNGASGDCSGACLVDAAGSATCMGSCTWVDRESDIVFITWVGQEAGSWKLDGGTGKWKNSSAQGTWKAAPETTAGNIGRNSWEGTFTMKK